MSEIRKRTRHDGWTDVRRTEFLGALRIDGNVRAACAWAGMSSAAAYALARRDPAFADAWAEALSQRDADRWHRHVTRPRPPLSDATLIRRLNRAEAAVDGARRGIVAQQIARRA